MKSWPVIILLIIAVAVLLGAYSFLVLDYLGQCRGNEALAARITEANSALARIPQPAQNLEQRLAAAEASLAEARSSVPGDPNSTRAINTLLKLAGACQVKAIPLSTTPWTVENNIHVFRLSMTVTGSQPQLAGFINQLEKGEFESFTIESLDVTGSSPDESVPVTAGLGLAIYGLPAE